MISSRVVVKETSVASCVARDVAGSRLCLSGWLCVTHKRLSTAANDSTQPSLTTCYISEYLGVIKSLCPLYANSFALKSLLITTRGPVKVIIYR